MLHHQEPIFAESEPGRTGASLPALDVPEVTLEGAWPIELRRLREPLLPEVSEPQVVRHYTRASQWNFSIDTGMYPLGSCTMKHNPKCADAASGFPCFNRLHPYQPEEDLQGALELMYDLERMLAEVGGFSRVTLQPSAGAQGELTGLMMIRAYHQDLGQRRTRVLIPDSAHGTNPASCTLNGFYTVQVPSGPDGLVHPDAVKAALSDDVAAIMITNPNTLGLFERHLAEIAEVVHRAGGLVYMDGANLNALMGRFRPGDMGVDVMHYNLHKTFGTPHGGGGPGAGPVGIAEKLVPFLPTPTVERAGSRYVADYARPKSIGRVRAFFGNFGTLLRAWVYLRENGGEGLRRVTDMAVLNANYLRARLKESLHVPFPEACMHEVVATDKHLKASGVTTLDLAKRLMDYGYHPPTVYFPLVVHGAFMVEPTETETLAELDRFVAAVEAIVREAAEDPERVKNAPHTTGLRRLDETLAARQPKLRWTPPAA
ncbi:MAG: aminomethyl-transferring glycine dehydrogenase subunit GcvPB [Deltaproteobacteria bacterium]|nr:aminomethyl-transferring glycine dehydrogenase subunit GcvPB [Deltaproteobacteria bacterium]